MALAWPIPMSQSMVPRLTMATVFSCFFPLNQPFGGTFVHAQSAHRASSFNVQKISMGNCASFFHQTRKRDRKGHINVHAIEDINSCRKHGTVALELADSWAVFPHQGRWHSLAYHVKCSPCFQASNRWSLDYQRLNHRSSDSQTASIRAWLKLQLLQRISTYIWRHHKILRQYSQQ